jgi:hypothetical protein
MNEPKVRELAPDEIEGVAGGMSDETMPRWVQTIGDLLRWLGVTQR